MVAHRGGREVRQGTRLQAEDRVVTAEVSRLVLVTGGIFAPLTIDNKSILVCTVGQVHPGAEYISLAALQYAGGRVPVIKCACKADLFSTGSEQLKVDCFFHKALSFLGC
jgi:hypothetical protein